MTEKYIGDRNFWKVTLRLAVPIAMQNLLVCSFNLIDTLMVGQLGDVALSSVGIAGQWAWLLNIMLFGINSGASVFISQYWGVKDKKGISRTFGIALVSALILGTVFTSLGALFPEAIIRIFNSSEQVVKSGSSYLRIASISYIAAVLSNVLSTVLRSTESVKLPMFVSAAAALANIVLNYGFIFGKFGFPELGVAGAAVATAISSWMGPILLLIISFAKKNILIAPLRDIFGFDFSMVKLFYYRAFPVMLNESMWGIGTVCYNIIFANLGYEYYAAVTILKTFENIAFVFFVGLCNACGIMIGKAVGAGKIKRAIEDARRFIFLIIASAVVVGAAVIIFRAPLIQIFNFGNNISQTTIDTGMWIMLIYGIEMPMRNIPYILIVGIFRPGGDTVTGAKYDLLTLWVIAIPATAIAAFVLKLPFPAVFAVMYLCEDYVKSFLCMRYYKKMKWLRPVTEAGKAGMELYKKEAGIEADAV